MKRRISLSIALALSVGLVLLTNSDSTVKAQNQMRAVADTGVVVLGPNQVLRLGIVNYRETDFNVRFRQIKYTQGVCSDGVCKQTISSQTASAPITLMPGEAASFDIPASFQGGVFVGVRGVVLSNSRNVRVNAMIIDTVTGQVDSVLIALIIP